MSRLRHLLLALTLLSLSTGSLATVPRQRPATGKAPPPAPAAGSLPPGARARLGETGLRHAGTVTGLAFAPDSKTLVSVGEDGVIRMWETATGRERAHFPFPAERAASVRQLGLSADGKILAFTGEDHAITLLDAASGKLLHRLKGPVRESAKERAPPFAFSPDGKTLASAGDDNTVRLWDVRTGREVRSFAAVPHIRVTQLVFPRDGSTLATLSYDGVACFWDTARGRLLQTARVPRRRYYSLAVSPDGKNLVTGGLREVQLWEVASGRERRRWDGDKSLVRTLAFAPDGTTLTAVSQRGDFRQWRLPDGKEVRRFLLPRELGSDNHFGHLTISPDGRRLAWVSWPHHNRIHLLDLQTGKHLDGGAQPSGALAAFSPDGKTIAIPCQDGAVRLWDTATGRVLRSCAGRPGPLSWLGFTPDGKTLLALGREVVFWEAATGKEVRRQPAPKLAYPTRAIALSPSGKVLAIGEVDRSRWPKGGCRVFLWDLEAGKESRDLKGAQWGSVAKVAFSPDGKRVASISDERKVHVWEVATGQLVRELFAPKDYGKAVAFADGGKSLLVFSAYYHKKGGDAFAVLRWGFGEREPQGSFGGMSLGVVHFLPVFSPSGHRLACPNTVGVIDVWRTDTGKRTHALRTGLVEWVMPLTFSPDGRLLATWHGDSTVLLWDVGGKP